MNNKRLCEFTNEQKEILKNKIGYTGDFYLTKQECNDLVDKVGLLVLEIPRDAEGYPITKEGRLIEDIITILTGLFKWS